MNRRNFLQTTPAAAGLTALAPAAKAAPNDRLRAGVIGAAGRARSLYHIFAKNPEVDVVSIADVDTRNFAKAVDEIGKIQGGKKPETHQDLRHLIDDDSLDILVVGTPDHWHAWPTIAGCIAGKDVYVEKPDAHNIIEGQVMIAAAKKHGRIVQIGSQHRSTERLQTALAYIREGHLGKAIMAKGWESSKQGGIGFPKDGTPPPEVDYDIWLGSAPKRPFNPARFHKNWRWFFDYGTGDLGNDGVHRLDMAYAALSAAIEAKGGEPLTKPTRISAVGGHWYFDDAQEFPDTLNVSYEFAGKQPSLLTYEMRIWTRYPEYGHSEGSAVFGDEGYIIIGNNGWKAYDAAGKLVKEHGGNSDATPHAQNFIDCVRSREKPLCDLETVGHPASVLCHAGNISARLGRTLTMDPETEMFENDDEANALRGRAEWREPWGLLEV